MSKVSYSDGPGGQLNDFLTAKMNEIKRLQQREIWRKVHKKVIYGFAHIIERLFLLTLKNYGTSSEKAKT